LSDLAAEWRSRHHPRIASAWRHSSGVSASIQEARRRFDHVSELATFSFTPSTSPSSLPITGSSPLFTPRTRPHPRPAVTLTRWAYPPMSFSTVRSWSCDLERIT
jgi:hypothetical protein